MFCKYCGNQIIGYANYCPRCGRHLPIAPAQTAVPMQTAMPAQAAVPVQTAVPAQAAVPQNKPVNGLGIAAFVVGIVSLFLGIYLFVLPIVGVVLGAVAVARRSKYRLNGLAIAGLSISCVAFAVWLIIWIYIALPLLFLIFLPLFAIA